MVQALKKAHNDDVLRNAFEEGFQQLDEEPILGAVIVCARK